MDDIELFLDHRALEFGEEFHINTVFSSQLGKDGRTEEHLHISQKGFLQG